MDNPPTLAGLPVELLMSIAEGVDKQDLIALRFANREISAGIDSVFLKAFFSRRTHIFTKFGLQALADIAAKDRTGRKLDHITIIVKDMVDAVAFEKDMRMIIPPSMRAPKPIATTSKDNTGDSAPTSPTLEEDDGEAGGPTPDSVASEEERVVIFDNLAKYGQTISVAVADSEWYGVYGKTTVKRLHAQPQRLTGAPLLAEASCDQVIHLLLQSVLQSEISLKALDLCSDSLTYGMQEQGLLSLAGLPGSKWQALKVLKLGLDEETDFSIKSSDGGSLDAMLRCLAGLEDLTVCVIESDDPDYAFNDDSLLELIKHALPTNRLRKLHLLNVLGREAEFIGLLSKHAATLAEVRLNNVSVPYHEDWDAVITFLGHTLQLHSLHLSYLYCRLGRAVRRCMVALSPTKRYVHT
ncbi:hypothetical protein LTR85_005917 [Meristemomyces frigidus]|nr:hypothetical protein LTR85_005917 [Meristemomyces frigidus]